MGNTRPRPSGTPSNLESDAFAQVAPKPLLSKTVGSTTIGWYTKSFW